ncbi:hypothetical protein KGP36_06705 [Patescibacteria group bacterium]|nr:hypothetical protein [Patescibacteria group bacterium]
MKPITRSALIGWAMFFAGLYLVRRMQDASSGPELIWQIVVAVLSTTLLLSGISLISSRSRGTAADVRTSVRKGQVIRLVAPFHTDDSMLMFLGEIAPGETYYLSVPIQGNQQKVKQFFTPGYYYRFTGNGLEKLEIGRKEAA